MIESPLPRILVRCEGAPVPLDWRGEPWTDRIDITTEPATDPAVNLVIRGLATTPLATPQPRTQDLVRILACIFRADEMVSRGRDADVHGDRWIREFGLCISVQDPDRWNDPAIQRLLSTALSFGADDRWRFHFSPRPRTAARAIQPTMDFGEAVAKHYPDCVTLVSGGLDSLTILAEAAARGERPLAVSHWAGPGTRSRQTTLLTDVKRAASLDERFGRWTFPAIGVGIHRLGQEARERTRRTRGVLFAGLGGAVAAEVGTNRVYLGDNGPISLNLPINDQLVGAHASRSTHPLLLQRMSTLLSAVYDTPITVENPLWARTRRETIEGLVQLGLAPLVASTLSCSHWGWGRQSTAVPQCGICSQCIDRRFATIAAGVSQFDPVERYAHDIFLQPLPDATSTLLAVGYVRFAQRVIDLNAMDLLMAYPQLTEAVLPDDPDPETTMAMLIDVTQRHASTVLDVVEQQVTDARSLLARGKVSATSLLWLSAVDPGLTAIAAPDPLPVTAPTVIPIRAEHIATKPNRMIQRGDMWDIEFQGRLVTLKDSDGVERLAFLLRHPGRLFTPPEVLIGAHGAAPAANHVIDENDEGWHEDGVVDEDPLFDQIAVTQIRQKIADLTRERDTARERGENDVAAAKDQEIQAIRTYRDQGTRPGRRSRAFPNSQSRQTNTVYVSLHRLIANLETRHPPLGKHLRITLVHGNQNGYRPDGEIQWVVERSSEAA